MKIRLLLPVLAGVFVVSVHASNTFTIAEDFSSDPMQNGWEVFGDTNLFHWDSTNNNLAVTWDSSQSNSYFHQALGTKVTKSDNFSVAFDLRLDDIGPSTDTNKPYSFNLSIGLLNRHGATQPGFLRGTGYTSPDLAEFSYFWDSGFGATTWPVLVDSFSSFNFSSTNDYAIFALTSGDWYRVVMNYTGANQTLVTAITNLAHNTGIIITAHVDNYFTDFAVDAISISSYNDTDGYEGSVLAHGAVDNLSVTVTHPPVKNMTGMFSNSVWQVEFISLPDWTYTLERSTNFVFWADASSPTAGNGTNLVLQDINAPPDNGFYRVRAQQP